MEKPDQLRELFRMQKSLNERIGVKTDGMNDEEKTKWLLNYTRAMQQEMAELTDSVPWKWWAKYQKFDEQNARVEVVDLFHFLISMAQVLGMSADDVFAAYVKKNEVNFKRQESGYTGVQIADRPEYALTHSLSIECWIRPRAHSAYIIFFRGDHRPGLDPYCLSMDGNQNLCFGISDGDNDHNLSVKTPVGLGAWIHAAGVLDDDTGTLSLYTNGVLAAQTTTNLRPFGALLPEESPGIGIGNVNDGGNNFPFAGEIDEVALYNRALSADEVNASYAEHAADAGEQVGPLPTRNNMMMQRFRSGIGTPTFESN